MLVLCIALLIVGFLLAVVGLRGRVVGDDPHCGHCGFNLRGRDPSSTRCSECGTELTEAAIRIGMRCRRPVVATLGLIILLPCGVGIGVGGWKFASTYDWTPWKPASWLVADMDSNDAIVRSNAYRELQRRIASYTESNAKVLAVVDGLLDRQADRSRKWDVMFGNLIDGAIKGNRLDAPRIQRYVRQGVSAALELKPKLRRKQSIYVHLQLKFDRFGGDTRFAGDFTTSALALGAETMLKPGWANSGGPRDQLSGVAGYGIGMDGTYWDNGKLPDGQYSAAGAVIVTAAMTEPAKTDAVRVEVPISAPVELLPEDAIVDEFKVDPGQRQAMRDAFAAARVLHNPKGRLEVRLKVAPLPYPVSADVLLRRGRDELRVGQVRLDGYDKPRWASAYNWRRPKPTTTAPASGDVVDIVLRPSQEPADSTRQLATYWGEEIVIPDVSVDAPYAPPFDSDESLRTGVEKALRRQQVWRNIDAARRPSLSLHLSAAESPVKLCYLVFLRAPDGREVKLDQAWTVPAKQANGWGTFAKDFDPTGSVTECDIVFRPDPDWETHSYDLVPPWGGEVVIPKVRIAPPATTPAK